MTNDKQRTLVFQENGSGEQKIERIRTYGKEFLLLPPEKNASYLN